MSYGITYMTPKNENALDICSNVGHSQKMLSVSVHYVESNAVRVSSECSRIHRLSVRRSAACIKKHFIHTFCSTGCEFR
ncbi:hypothetical protein F2P79_000004 [Pimephales promelas]|nr:hypothetical protein F2P79_000004 [Pimephales promelas]